MLGDPPQLGEGGSGLGNPDLANRRPNAKPGPKEVCLRSFSVRTSYNLGSSDALAKSGLKSGPLGSNGPVVLSAASSALTEILVLYLRAAHCPLLSYRIVRTGNQSPWQRRLGHINFPLPQRIQN